MSEAPPPPVVPTLHAAVRGARSPGRPPEQRVIKVIKRVEPGDDEPTE
ncbi:MAG TPA: hypothetical protein PKJ99_10960 [Thermoanaerobaculales bacterium]|nr:hypothetical protein [Thermoanaerobaculales bacterium]HQL30571.1 hypothetical protein [Thermoanaerobaculales bacterium]